MENKKNIVPTIDEIISELYPFTGGDLTIAKKWFNKLFPKLEDYYEPFIKLNKWDVIEALNSVERILKQDLENSIKLGVEAHELIQNHLKERPEYLATVNDYYENPFFNQFVGGEDKKVINIIHSIKQLLPAEVPMVCMGGIRWQEAYGTPLFAGQWDLLYKDINGKYILVDIKTGSPLEYDDLDKKTKIKLSMCVKLAEQNLNIKIDECQVWEITKDEFNIHSYSPQDLEEIFYMTISAYNEKQDLINVLRGTTNNVRL